MIAVSSGAMEQPLAPRTGPMGRKGSARTVVPPSCATKTLCLPQESWLF